jgi:tetratricopeptide (TPR) repeat protein
MSRVAAAALAMLFALGQPAVPALAARGGAEAPLRPDAAAGETEREQMWATVGNLFQAYALDEALALLDELARQAPFEADIPFMRGYALHLKRDEPAAIAAFDRAIGLTPRHAMAFAQRGLSRALLGEHAAALADVEEALRIDPEHATAMAHKGFVLIAAGREAEGLAALDAAVAMAPGIPWMLLARSVAHADLGRTETALADVEAALALDDEEPAALGLRARLRLAAGPPAAALADAETALALGGQEPWLIRLRAEARESTGDAAGAARDRAMLAARHPWAATARRAELPSVFGSPTHATARLAVALRRIGAGDAEGALAIAERVARDDPWAAPSARMVRAYGLHELARHDEALAELDAVEAAQGAGDETHYLRAKVLWTVDRRADALRHIDSAVAADPAYSTYRQTRATFRYETGDMAGALADVEVLEQGEDYGEWAALMRILLLDRLRRREEAARLALAWIEQGRPVDANLDEVLPDMIWRLQAGGTWPLADRLLAAATPPPLGEQFDLYLQARSHATASRGDEAAALLQRLSLHEVAIMAMSDPLLAPLRDRPALRSTFDPGTLFHRSLETALALHRENPGDLPRAILVVEALAASGCGDGAAARLEATLDVYPRWNRWGGALFERLAEAARARGDAAAAVAILDRGTARLGPGNPYSLPLQLEAAAALLAAGQPAEALERLAALERRGGAYGYGLAVSEFLRAAVHDAQGRPADRDRALDRLAARAGDAPAAAVFGLGLFRSYEAAVAAALAALRDHADGELLIRAFERRTAATSDLDRRTEALAERLRADPRVRAAMAPVGRVLLLPATTCPLGTAELAGFPIEPPANPIPAAGPDRQ